MFSVTAFVLLMLLGHTMSLSNKKCFPLNGLSGGGSICYMLPNPLLALSWSGATQWCKNIGATLPTPETKDRNTVYKNALSYFGLHTESLWLGANLTYDSNKWHWTNGSRFTGTVENSNIPGNTYAYMIRNGSEIKYVAASPSERKYGMLQQANPSYTEMSCATLENSYWTRESCYFKYWNLTYWNQFWSSCGEANNVACIDNLDDFSRWLEDLQGFWIGLRSSWWTWYNFATNNSYEVFDTYFGYLNDLPNSNSTQCLASYPCGQGNYLWTNPDCTSNLPFICQYDPRHTSLPAEVSPPTAHSPITSTPNAPTTEAGINPTTTSSTITQVTITPTTVSASSLSTTAPSAAGFSSTVAQLPITSTPDNPATTSSAITQVTITPSTASPMSFPTSTPSAMFTTVPPNTTAAKTTTPTPNHTTSPRATVSGTSIHLPGFPTSSPASASEVQTVASSTQTVTTTSLGISNIIESKPAIFGLSAEFWVVLGGGLFIAASV